MKYLVANFVFIFIFCILIENVEQHPSCSNVDRQNTEESDDIGKQDVNQNY